MTCRYINDTSTPQPFLNPGTGDHEWFERYPGNDILSTQPHLRTESMGRPVAIRYLLGTSIHISDLYNYVHDLLPYGYTVMSYTIQDIHPFLYGPTPCRPFININLIDQVLDHNPFMLF